jgi:hypothetical protein
MAAHFQPGPGAVRHGGEHPPDETGKRSIHAGNLRFEGGESVGVQAHRERGVAGQTIEDIDRRRTHGGLSVRTQEAAERLAQLEHPTNISWHDRCAIGQQTMRNQPGAQLFWTRQFTVRTSPLSILGIHERLHHSQRSRRSFAQLFLQSRHPDPPF